MYNLNKKEKKLFSQCKKMNYEIKTFMKISTSVQKIFVPIANIMKFKKIYKIKKKRKS